MTELLKSTINKASSPRIGVHACLRPGPNPVAPCSQSLQIIHRPTVSSNFRLGLQTTRQYTAIIPHAAASSAPQAASGLWAVLCHAYASDPVGVLLGIAVSIAAVALSAMMLAAIPAVVAMRRTAHAAEKLLHALHEELPDTVAALRLSGLEVADAVQEVTALGTDLTQGVRASARAIVSAEQGLRDGINAVTTHAVPTIKKAIPSTKDKVESALKVRSRLDTTESLKESAGATRQAVKRLRNVLGAAAMASTAVNVVKGSRRRRQFDPYSTAGAISDSDGDNGSRGA